jgi:hypothetical protein
MAHRCPDAPWALQEHGAVQQRLQVALERNEALEGKAEHL